MITLSSMVPSFAGGTVMGPNHLTRSPNFSMDTMFCVSTKSCLKYDTLRSVHGSQFSTMEKQLEQSCTYVGITWDLYHFTKGEEKCTPWNFLLHAPMNIQLTMPTRVCLTICKKCVFQNSCALWSSMAASTMMCSSREMISENEGLQHQSPTNSFPHNNHRSTDFPHQKCSFVVLP